MRSGCWTTMVLVAGIMLAGIGLAPAQDLDLVKGWVMGGPQLMYPTSASAIASSYRFGPVQRSQDAKEINLMYQADVGNHVVAAFAGEGSGMGTTTYTMLMIEWYPADPSLTGSPLSPYRGMTFTSGFALPTSYPAVREVLRVNLGLYGGSTTATLYAGLTSLVTSVTAEGVYYATTTTKMPFFRVCSFNRIGETHFPVQVTVWGVLKYD